MRLFIALLAAAASAKNVRFCCKTEFPETTLGDPFCGRQDLPARLDEPPIDVREALARDERAVDLCTKESVNLAHFLGENATI